MSAAPANGSAKPSFFGKMYNFAKTVAERVMDPDAIPSDDEADDAKGNENDEEDAQEYTLDFRRKYVPGQTVSIVLDSTDSETVPIVPPEHATEDLLGLDALHIEPSELEIDFEKEAAEAPVPAPEEQPAKGFIARSTGTSFCTRVGPNYKANKNKAPSAPALAELMSADFVRTPCRIPDIGRYLEIPPEWTAVDTYHTAVQPLFIVHAQIPNKWPTTVFVETTDGPCYSFVMIYRLTQATLDALADLETAPPAVKLYAQYCSECRDHDASAGDSASGGSTTGTTTTSGSEPSTTTDGKDGKEGGKSDREWIGRTKVFVRCDNLPNLKLPKFLLTYNAKPALIRESGTLVRGVNYLELDVNIKKFGLLANKTLPLLIARSHLMDLHVGLCVESREEEEMPEGMLGCCRVHKISSASKDVPMWFVRKNE